MSSLAERYSLTHQIQETAATRVFRGFRCSDLVPVVVKRPRNEFPSQAEILRLEHEYSILRSIDSPYVARAFGLERSGTTLALVLEDAGDTSLESLVRDPALTLERALGVAETLAGAVASIHDRGIIHKDLKPGHFFFDREHPERVKLIDFGIATRLTREAEFGSALTELEGSPAYIAPEQTGRMNRAVDDRSDLYSLGVTLYELFTGRLPFDSTDLLELIHSHIARPPPPPDQIRPGLPAPLCRIVLRLLSKVADDRYQSAAGVRRDLERCLQAFHATGTIADFELGVHDRPRELRIPQQLFGRERELSTLMTRFEVVKTGACELFLLAGYSGIGKSALVKELERHLGLGGHFVSGKFDYLNRSEPYGAIARASRELILATLAEPEAALARRRSLLTQALGANAGVLVELLPELELLLGRQPPPAAVGPNEVQLRFELSFQHFLSSFSGHGQPLVVFLDDLQWADAASLNLLKRLLTSGACGHLLLVGAYRDNEVDSVHPLSMALEQLAQAGAAITRLALAPLALPDVEQMVAATVGASEVRPLCEILLAKTHGNPFFLGQFLKTLHREGSLYFDDEKGRFQWDLGRVGTALATDNVVDFLLERLRNLPAAAQELVRLAACVGHRFDVRTLSLVSRRSVREVMSELWPALQEGFVLPLDGNYRYADVVASDEAVAPPNAQYRFLHDRVQQAAYALIEPEKRAEVHLCIGRSMLGAASDPSRIENLFEVADHLNRGRVLVTDPAEKMRLSRIDLLAGNRARNAAAPEAALRYLSVARELARDSGLAEYEHTHQVTLLLAECSFLDGKFQEAFACIDELEAFARSTLDRVPGRNLRSAILTCLSRFEEACVNSVETARLLGAEIPEPSDKAALGGAIGASFGAYQGALAGREIESLAELPPMSDPRMLALSETFMFAIPQSFQSNQELMVLMVLKAVALPLEYGSAPQSPFFYEQYGIVHWVVTADYATSYRFGELGIRLTERLQSPAARGPVHFIFGGFVAHWKQHISVSIEHLGIGLRLSLETGDLFHTNYCATFRMSYFLYAGTNLDVIESELDDVDKLLSRSDDVVNKSFAAILRQTALALKGRTAALDRFDSEVFDEAAFVANGSPPARAMYAAAKAMLCYLAGKPEQVVEVTDAYPPLPAFFYNTLVRFYRALAMLDLCRTASAPERERLLGRFAADLATLRGYAAAAPSNHQHRVELLVAEEAASRGDAEVAAAMAAYDRAIALAQEHGFIQDQALANELCARFHLAHGRSKVARPYLAEAYYTYQRWGAVAKAEELRQRHAEHSGEFTAGPQRSARDARSTTYEPASQLGGGLDVAAAVRAMEAVATELVLERVLERLMRTLIGSAGAQRGFLVLERAGRLEIEASMTIEPDLVRLGISQPIEGSDELSVSIVQYASRTQQAVILPDAPSDPRFSQDPYLARRKPKSVLCVPMLHRGRLVGVLYLENNSATAAFSPARASFLKFLAAQAAVAVENAKLYGELNAATESLRRTNETLEAQVQERTAELRSALSDLWSEMDLAKKIQTVLLPETKRVGRYEVAATMIAADSVGGDYYDVVEAGDRDWIMIGDVSGHGVTAGLIMMMIQTAVRTIVLNARQRGEELSPALVLSRANSAVRGNLQRISDGQYMTITALELSGARIRYSGLHQDILVHRAANDTVQRIATHGIWLGLIDDISDLLENDTIELQEGDTILLYTDGITEMMLGEERLGTAGLTSRFHALASRSHDPRTIVDSLLSQIGGRADSDDVTLMALRYGLASAAE
jgi:predicted ATPase/serine phosphatase RsbU (regulator of sigma subunit)